MEKPEYVEGMTEKQKMIAGLPYDPMDAELERDRLLAHDLCHDLAHARPSGTDEISHILTRLFRRKLEKIVITPPFFCDYGYNIILGKGFFSNADCVILDCAPVNIGENVFLGPKTQIYTPLHPLNPAERLEYEYAAPVSIGHTVWIGGGAIICPGVNIGPGCVIGAGSVVTRDIPAWSLAVGNPCRVIRQLPAMTY